jgi:hypothetical protein
MSFPLLGEANIFIVDFSFEYLIALSNKLEKTVINLSSSPITSLTLPKLISRLIFF